MSLRLAYVVSLLVVGGACGPSGPARFNGPYPPDGSIVDTAVPLPEPDGTPGTIYEDADINGDGGCAQTACPDPVMDGCLGSDSCGSDGAGDGLDNDCDGMVDETCNCTPGDVRPCFRGPPGRRNIGSCEDGTMLCHGTSEFGTWGECTGGIFPTAEACDTQDNNCNGCADDNPLCCDVILACPGPGDLPEASPFTNYVINGTTFFGGSVSSWAWTVVGGPCDVLLAATSGTTSYTLTGAATSSVTFRPKLSGDYTFTVTITASDGTVYTCTFVVHVRGPGMRVELCWDTTGSSDIDLHTHQDSRLTSASWFDSAADCFYSNCRASNYLFGSAPPWGHATSPLTECSGTTDGPTWSSVGFCGNPRLDIDNISTIGIPENINIDTPIDGAIHRVMVHYYGGGSTVVHPLVNIYCDGTLRGSYGVAPDTVPGFDMSGGFGGGDMWRVVDVTTNVSAGVVTCDLAAIHPPGLATGYYVTTGSTAF